MSRAYYLYMFVIDINLFVMAWVFQVYQFESAFRLGRVQHALYSETEYEVWS